MFISVCALFSGHACAQPAALCPPAEGVAVQVLGSGGPIADDARASTAYIVWIDGKSRVLIDAGGGSFLRFGEAHASFNDLELIGLSHFHADHSADFVALLKSGNFANRDRPLTVVGPSGAPRFPGLDEFLHSNLNSETGAFKYLSGYLDGSGGLPLLIPLEIGPNAQNNRDLLPDVYTISAFAAHVPHGIVPALAFRIEAGRGKAIVFSSDQNGSDPEFGKFAQDASLLVMHMPIPENAGDAAKELHAVPSRVAEIAAAAHADRLLLSHFMARSLENREENLQQIRSGFGGTLVSAFDMDCIGF